MDEALAVLEAWEARLLAGGPEDALFLEAARRLLARPGASEEHLVANPLLVWDALQLECPVRTHMVLRVGPVCGAA
jgi:hypothetical protein